MKKYLLTLVVLLLASTAFAECALIDVTRQAKESSNSKDPHMTGSWIVLLDADNVECWYELTPDIFDSPDCTTRLALIPDNWGIGNVSFYFMVEGKQYGAESDMQIPEFSDSENINPNLTSEGENMFCVPVLYNEYTYYTYVFGLQFIDDNISLIVSQGIIWYGGTTVPVFNGYTEDGSYAHLVEITPTESSFIFYRVQYPDETWSEWTEYTETLRFTNEGKYHIEAYALAYNKTPSEVIEYDFEISTLSSIDETIKGKEVASVRYFNMAGQEMREVNGMTIVVTTYNDRKTSAVKVMK